MEMDDFEAHLYDTNLVALSYAGGESGNEVTRGLLRQARSSLNKGGRIYLLLVKENEPEKLLKELGMKWELLSKSQCRNEELGIYLIQEE